MNEIFNNISSIIDANKYEETDSIRIISLDITFNEKHGFSNIKPNTRNELAYPIIQSIYTESDFYSIFGGKPVYSSDDTTTNTMITSYINDKTINIRSRYPITRSDDEFTYSRYISTKIIKSDIGKYDNVKKISILNDDKSKIRELDKLFIKDIFSYSIINSNIKNFDNKIYETQPDLQSIIKNVNIQKEKNSLEDEKDPKVEPNTNNVNVLNKNNENNSNTTSSTNEVVINEKEAIQTSNEINNAVIISSNVTQRLLNDKINDTTIFDLDYYVQKDIQLFIIPKPTNIRNNITTQSSIKLKLSKNKKDDNTNNYNINTSNNSKDINIKNIIIKKDTEYVDIQIKLKQTNNTSNQIIDILKKIFINNNIIYTKSILCGYTTLTKKNTPKDPRDEVLKMMDNDTLLINMFVIFNHCIEKKQII